MQIRAAVPSDAEPLAQMLHAYLAERYPDHPGTDAAQLRRDVFESKRQQIIVAENDRQVVGFVAFDPIYDMHWAAAGIQIADLYVAPPYRGFGLAVALLVEACAAGRRAGATFLAGPSYDQGSAVGRFYERLAVGWPTAQCRLGGHAFRAIAEQSGRPIRAILRSLPPKIWNYEP
jgi:GNAT superfamily N-acetyltransferase